MGVTRAALRESLRLELGLLSPIAGALTALPLVGVFALGLAFSTPRTAVALAVGANLVAIVSLIAAPRLSLPLAGADALAMAVSVFVGTVTAPYPWLHNLLLVPWCFAAGLMIVLGQTPGAIGSQAVIAFVVLGRFAGSPGVALHLAVAVLVGALVEVAGLTLLRLPPSLRFQRLRVALALEAVAELARDSPHRSAIEVLAVVDEAEHAVSSPSLFGRSDVRDLRNALDQVRRIRLALTTLAGLRARLGAAHSPALFDIDGCLATGAHALESLAQSLRRRTPGSWQDGLAAYRAALERLDGVTGTANADDAPVVEQCRAHLAALTGQLRSTGTFIDHLVGAADRRAWRPRLPEWERVSPNAHGLDLSLARDALRRESPAFRHAVRLAVAVPVSAWLASWLGLPRGYWLPFAVVVILKPDYSTLLRRGVGRVVGTALGASLAAVLVSEIHPSLALTAALASLLAWLAYTTWSASFAVAIGFVTALVLVLLTTSSVDTVGTALDRLLDVTLGGVIAVATYLVWPTPSRAGVVEAFDRLFGSLRDYLEVVAPLVEGREVDPALVVERSRRARTAWGGAEAAVGRSVEEPSSTRLNPTEGRGMLAVTLRILRATHALRIEAGRGAVIEASPAYEELVSACLSDLGALSDVLAEAPPDRAAHLRRRYRDAEREWADRAPASVEANLDELVNAINTAGHLTRARHAEEAAPGT